MVSCQHFLSSHSIKRKYKAYIVDAKIIQRLGNLNLLWEVKEGIGELLSFSQRTLDDLKSRDIAQKVACILVWVRTVGMWVVSALNGGESGVGCKRQQSIMERLPSAFLPSPLALLAPFEFPLACPLLLAAASGSHEGHMVVNT